MARFPQASIFSDFEPQGKSLHEAHTTYSDKIPRSFAGRLRSVINRCGGGSREHAVSGLSAFISQIMEFLSRIKEIWKSMVVELN